MSDSVRPHRWQPPRLPCPWDSPGKNTAVGCHFLLQCTKMQTESEVTQSCPTLCNPMDCSPPGSSAHGIFQVRALEWGAMTRYIHSYIHCSIICNSQGLKTPKCPSMDEWIKKMWNTHIHSYPVELLLSYKRIQILSSVKTRMNVVVKYVLLKHV